MHAFISTLTPQLTALLTIGLVSTGLQVAFSLATSRLRLLLFNFGATLMFLAQYLLLGQWVGFYSGLIAAAYTATLAAGYRWPVLQRRAWTWVAASGYLAVFLSLTDWSHFVVFEAIPLVAGVSTLVALHSQNLIFAKAVFIADGLLWLTYELFNGMFTQTLGEVFELVGNALTLTVLVRASQATRRGLRTQPTSMRADLDAVDTELLEIIDAAAAAHQRA